MVSGVNEGLDDFLRAEGDCVLVRVIVADGSTPRDADAFMLVAAQRLHGTIGGGQLEYMAIDHARRSLRQGSGTDRMTIPLGPEIGQCCGGRVSLRFDRMDMALKKELLNRNREEKASRPHVYIFGAGHVGHALAACLALAPVRTILVDTREAELAGSHPAGVETCLTAVPEALVREAPARSAYVILTHDHALDFLITAEALARSDAAYVGMIGSRTKRATFRNWLSRELSQPGLIDGLVCPIGASGVKDKRPAVIAAFATAEILAAVLAAQPGDISELHVEDQQGETRR